MTCWEGLAESSESSTFANGEAGEGYPTGFASICGSNSGSSLEPGKNSSNEFRGGSWMGDSETDESGDGGKSN